MGGEYRPWVGSYFNFKLSHFSVNGRAIFTDHFEFYRPLFFLSKNPFEGMYWIRNYVELLLLNTCGYGKRLSSGRHT